MKSELTVSGSRESETSALIVVVLGMILNVHDFILIGLVFSLFFCNNCFFKSGLKSKWRAGARAAGIVQTCSFLN